MSKVGRVKALTVAGIALALLVLLLLLAAYGYL